jgi:hypothetical protein
MSTGEVTILRSANIILAELLRGNPSGLPYHLTGMYIEYQNGDRPVLDNFTVPYDSGLDYYDALKLSADRDYLRVNIAVITPHVNPADKLNIQLACQALVLGDTGQGGKPFSAEAGSRIYGAALVAMPTQGLAIDDPTRDIIWSRGYLAEANQLSASQLTQQGITFILNFN